MDKITIEIGGFRVIANSPEEAREIMGLSLSSGTTKPLVPRLRKVDELTVPIDFSFASDNRKEKKNKRKKHMSNHWLPEEVEFMANLMKTESIASVSRSKYLLQRHTESAINMMGWKVSRNPVSLKVTPENQAIVDRFQEWKANHK